MEGLIKFIKNLELNLFGFTDLSSLKKYEKYYINRDNNKINPFEIVESSGKLNPLEKYPHLDSVIVIGFPYLFSHTVKYPSFSFYTRGRDYHRVAETYLLSIAEYLKCRGYEAEIFCDSNPLTERLLGLEAGLGFIGRNNMLINKEYGSYFFIGEILTNMNLKSMEEDFKENTHITHEPKANNEVDYEENSKGTSITNLEIGEFTQCGECRNCISGCPAGILGEEYTDTNKCLSYITQKKELSDVEIVKLKGRLFGCDTCQIVCPYNKGKENMGLDILRPYEYMENLDLEEISMMTKKGFEKYRKTSAGWRGKTILQRNAIIALAEGGNFIPLDGLKSDKLIEETKRITKLFKDGENVKGY